jgi:valyl-tRNA synthetase
MVPENQRKIFLDWMANIRDWCISRQLWWGHRIPVWHCSCGGMTPARDSKVEIVNGHARPASPPEKCDKCGGTALEQDKDVLDTWFSSGLWPLSTLGWPDDTPDLRKFYPTTLLISGYDILFFWDARMVMMDMHLAPERMKTTAERVPFRTLYLHSLVRDAQGQKMSKMRGNVINPLDWLEKYGTDALRFTLAIKAAPGTDIALSEDAVLSYRAFANKIWNAARFLFVNLQKCDASDTALETLASPDVRNGAPYAAAGELALIDRWIFSRLARVVPQVNEALAEFRFHEAAHAIYHFFWGDFCDWYIEWNKPRLSSSDQGVARAAWRNIFAVYEASLRLLHPFMPFITEEIWHSLPQPAAAKSISLAQFPVPPAKWIDERAEREMVLLQEIIVAARNLRAEMKLDPKKPVAADFASSNSDLLASLERNADAVKRLTPLSSLAIAAGRMDGAANGDGMSRSTADFDLRIPYSETFDPQAEIAKLRKEIERLEKDIASKERQLGDQTFRSRAPEHIVRGLEKTLAERRVEKQKFSERLGQLGAASAR